MGNANQCCLGVWGWYCLRGSGLLLQCIGILCNAIVVYVYVKMSQLIDWGVQCVEVPSDTRASEVECGQSGNKLQGMYVKSQ